MPFPVIAALSAVAYLNAGHAEFFFDSAGALIANPRTTDLGGTFRRLWQAPLGADEQVSHLTFALNYALNRALGRPGFEVAGFLVFNVLLHALNGCLVYVLLRRLWHAVHPDRPPPILLPLLVASLFVVHPLHASSVAYIAQRRGVLATAFYLLGVLAYLRLRTDTRRALWRSVLRGAVVALCWWLSFRSKSMGLTLPATLLALEFCLRAPDRTALRRYVRVLVPGVVLCLLAMLVFLWAQGLLDVAHLRIRPHGHAEIQAAWPHFLAECRVFMQYWKLLLLPWPQWMSIDHDFPVAGSALPAVIFHALLLALGIFAARRRYTLAAAGLFWFYVTLLPYAVVPQSELFVEYKTYLPSIGLALILAELLTRAAVWPGAVPSALACGLVAAVLLGTTIYRNRVYRSTASLWADAVAKYPQRLRPRVNLGTALLSAGRVDQAIEQFNAALQINPNSYTARTGLGVALADQGKLDEARPYYEAALAIKPDYAEALIDLALLLSRQGKLDEADAHYEEALQSEPENDKAHNNLGVNLAREGRTAAALEHFAAALRANPEYAEAHFNLALTLVKVDRFDEAVAHYRTAIRLDPQYCPAYYKLGEALVLQGQMDAAIAQFHAALRIKPDFAPAHGALGGVLQKQGQLDRAMQQYREALRLEPSYADAHYGLGQVLEALGRVADAVAEYQQALRSNPEHAAARARLDALSANRAGG